MQHYSYLFNKKSNQINVSHNNNIIRKIIVNQTDNINSNNLEKKQKIHNFCHRLTTKTLTNDNINAFNFKNASWHLTIIYLISFISIPILYSLIKTYGFHEPIFIKNGNNNVSLFIFYFVPFCGFLLSLAVDWKTMITKGGWIAYGNLLFALLATLLFSFLSATNIFVYNEKNVTSVATQTLITFLCQFCGSILLLATNKAVRTRIITTLKEAKSDLLTWVIIILGLAISINSLVNLIPNSTNSLPFFANVKTSKNQEGLNFLLTSGYGIFVLIISTVILAPINEELTYRQGLFTIVRYRWLAFAVSAFYFAAMHVMENGDWQQIKGYLTLSIFISLLFVLSRGNVTYTITLHSVFNLTVTIYNIINPPAN